ncbi:hypothetical protein P7C70_g8408, partial [Phenoliferia sp. Uapishka_3]
MKGALKSIKRVSEDWAASAYTGVHFRARSRATRGCVRRHAHLKGMQANAPCFPSLVDNEGRLTQGEIALRQQVLSPVTESNAGGTTDTLGNSKSWACG